MLIHMKRKANGKAAVQRHAHVFMRFSFYFWSFTEIADIYFGAVVRANALGKKCNFSEIKR